MCKGTKLVGTTWKIIQLFMQNKICGFMEIKLQEKSMAKRQEKRKVLGNSHFQGLKLLLRGA